MSGRPQREGGPPEFFRTRTRIVYDQEQNFLAPGKESLRTRNRILEKSEKISLANIEWDFVRKLIKILLEPYVYDFEAQEGSI